MRVVRRRGPGKGTRKGKGEGKGKGKLSTGRPILRTSYLLSSNLRNKKNYIIKTANNMVLDMCPIPMPHSEVFFFIRLEDHAEPSVALCLDF